MPAFLDFYQDRPLSLQAIRATKCNPQAMLTRLYIEALLVDEELADQVWEALMAGEIDDLSAWTAWLIVSCNSSNP